MSRAVLPASRLLPRSFYLIKALLPVCALLLLLLPLPSWAGQWVITYSNTGKTTYDIIRPPSSLTPYSNTNSPTSSGAGVSSASGKVDFIANASVVATLTWQPAYGKTMTTDPPPTSPVSILQTATAWENPGIWGGPGSAPVPAGTVSDSFGDPRIVSYNGCGYALKGVHLIQKDGSSGVVTLDPVMLSASCPHTTFDSTGNWQGSGGVSVNLSVQVAQATLGAHSTVDTSAPGNPWNPALPRFFSGTNCSAAASAVALSGYVSHAELLVGGTDVKDYYDTSVVGHPAAGPFVTLGTNQASASLSVNFDSTHFADASPISIKLVVTDTNSNTYTGQISANSYNKGYDGGGSGNGNNNQTAYGAQAASFVQGQYQSSDIMPTLGPATRARQR